ncbi:unnamed protein product [Caenorhabditis sp. 36 PRJEB53466]|nr:unnamed protein product [Caenorhabditis sp. 36 PRJEB53466]
MRYSERCYVLGHLFTFLIALAITATLIFFINAATSPSPSPSVTVSLSDVQPTSTEKPSKVWDTMDGEGYQFKATDEQVTLDKRYEELSKLPSCGQLSQVQEEVKAKLGNVKKQFAECITPIVEQWRGNAREMNVDWVEKAAICDQLPVFQTLGIVPFANLHEIKWTILPRCTEQNVLLTLGVGHDTVAEETLNRTLPNTKFYGADPIIEPNRQLFSAVGKFFPFAIGRNPGFSTFRVLPNQNQKTRNYVYQDVTTIDLIYFLKGVLKLKKIDFAWIDIEGGEFEFIDMLHRDGPLDKEGISICQFNLEVHSKFHPPGAQIYHDFIFKVLEEQRYVFLQSLHTDVGVHRMYFINVENTELAPWRMGPRLGILCSLVTSTFIMFHVVRNANNYLQAEIILPTDTKHPIFQAFYNCVTPHLNPLKGDFDKFYHNFVNLTADCDKLPAFEALAILPLANQDEVKHVVLPLTNETITMITFGIGHDTDAEESLKKIYPQTEFFGFDPIAEINKELYEKIGTYIPLAISGSSGSQISHVYRDKYNDEVLLHIGAGYYLDEVLQKKRIDVLWVDTEGQEYSLLGLFHAGGEFDRRGIKVCQMNFEMHLNVTPGVTNETQKFHDFVWRILADGKYVMLRPFYVVAQQFRFIRTFLVNVKDKECTDLYIQK